MQFQRYAIYFVPSDSELSRFGKSWLGWDCVSGQTVPHPEVPNLPLSPAEITQTPRRYGLHATLQPPFEPVYPQDENVVRNLQNVREFCTTFAPVRLEGLTLTRLGRFLALVPVGETGQLSALAAELVRHFRPLRRMPDEAELTRRRANGRLTPRQDALLTKWGYPYVMEEFRFHITLSSKLPKAQVPMVQEVLQTHIAPLIPAPFEIDALSLMGEDAEGRFHQIERVPLTGSP